MRLGDEVDILSVDDIELPTVVAGRFKGIVTVEGTKADPPATVAGLNASWVAMTFQATTAILTTTISQVATSGKWAFATSTAANALVIRCRQMQADLEELTQKLETAGLITVTGN
jgi:chromosome segregation ATPase